MQFVSAHYVATISSRIDWIGLKPSMADTSATNGALKNISREIRIRKDTGETMCKVVYTDKLSVSASGNRGYELTVEVCSEHPKEHIEALGKMALEAAKSIRKMVI